MKYEVALKKEQLFSDLFSMLTTYVNDLDKRQKHDYETICFDVKYFYANYSKRCNIHHKNICQIS